MLFSRALTDFFFAASVPAIRQPTAK